MRNAPSTRLACLIALSAALASIPLTATADSAAGPRGAIANVVKTALGILRDGKIAPDVKRQKIQQIAYDNMNFDVMAKLSLGQYYRGLTDTQKSEYGGAFKQFVTNSYRHTTDHYTDEDVKITADRKEQGSDWTVQTEIVGTKDNKPGQVIARVDYRLRSTADNQWKVVDLTIDNVSLVVNFRSQFTEIMAQGGFDKLMVQLRQKNAENDK